MKWGGDFEDILTEPKERTISQMECCYLTPKLLFAEGKDEAQLVRGEVEMKARSGSPGFQNEGQKLA